MGVEPTNDCFAGSSLCHLGTSPNFHLCEGMIMEPIVARVVQRYLKTSFKYKPKEKNKSKADRLSKLIREKTGLSNKLSDDIANSLVRGRDLESLALQKSWPIEDGDIKGPKGSFGVDKVKAAL